MQNVAAFIKNDGSGYKWRYTDSDMPIKYLKLHVENSLNFWNPKDIILATNFPFEYMGVKAYEIQSDIRKWSSFSNKLMVVAELIKREIINEEFWHKDLDAFQLQPFNFPIDSGVGFTQHAPGRTKLQGGSSFYAKDSMDLPGIMSEGMRLFKARKEEDFFNNLYFKRKEGWKASKIEAYKNKPEQLAYIENHFCNYTNRLHMINWTYNLFRVRDFKRKWPKTEKPVKICHFKPEVKNCAKCFVYGENKYNVNVVDDRLRKLMEKHELIWRNNAT